LPEEQVRQKLVHKMVQLLGYPLECLSMEASLKSLPHIRKDCRLPARRADLIVFAKNIHPDHSFYPLLLVECKAVPLTKKTMRQLVGYNEYVQAYFIAAVNQTASFTGWYEESCDDYRFQDEIIPYQQLIDNIRPRT